MEKAYRNIDIFKIQAILVLVITIKKVNINDPLLFLKLYLVTIEITI